MIFANSYSGLRWVLSAVALTLSFTAHAEDKFSVAILLFDDVQIIDFSAPYEVFGQAKFNVFTVSKDAKPVKTAMGLDVTPSYDFASMPQANAILIPGGNVHDAMSDKAIRAWLHRQQKRAQHILSVCTGSHILAESGLLDNKAATTFHGAIPGFSRNYPKIKVLREKRFVDNGQIITSAGLSSGIDASLHLVSKVLGMEKAKTIALNIEYNWDPEGGFVRALMADRMFPDNEYDWPEGAQFERLFSYGDRQTWRTRFQVTTEVGMNALLASYKKAMATHDDWVKRKDNNSEHLVWQKQDNNQKWLHELVITDAQAANQYTFTMSVKQVN